MPAHEPCLQEALTTSRGARAALNGGVLCLALVVFSSGIACGGDPASTDLPNVLLISLDACRADRLSVYGYERRTSPFLETLAERGILFTNAFVNTLPTLQSHATILSSQYQETHKLLYYRLEGRARDNLSVPEGLVMLQGILQERGYVTLAATDGAWVRGELGFERGFDEYRDKSKSVVEGVEAMVDLIRRHSAQDRPIFAFYHTYQIHAPYAPPPPYREIFGRHDSDFVPSGENLLATWKDASTLGESDLAKVNALYDGEIRYVDDTLRLLFEMLDREGFFDNYLLVLTADHGEELGDHGRLLHGNSLYDELLHVPLLVTGSSVLGGVVDDRMASSIDIVPTVLAHLGIPPPIELQGSDLLAPPDKSNAFVISQFGNELYSVRTERWKLIEQRREKTVRLFDLRRDPLETSDVASEHPVLVGDLQAILVAWAARMAQEGEPMIAKPIEVDEQQQDRLRALGYLE